MGSVDRVLKVKHFYRIHLFEENILIYTAWELVSSVTYRALHTRRFQEKKKII